MTFNRGGFNHLRFNRGGAKMVRVDAPDSLVIVLTDDLYAENLPIKSVSDTLIVTLDESMKFTLSKFIADTFALVLSESVDEGSPHSACLANPRKIYAKVEITYSAPDKDDYMTLSASGTAYGTDVNDTADNSEGSEKVWFAIGSALLDGQSYLAPTSEGSIGWWSDVISDSNGEFTVPPTITVQFSREQTVANLKVIGDDKLDCYPVDFTISLYDDEDALLHEEVVTDNDDYEWRLALDPTHDGVMKIVLSISKINQENTNAKVTEFYTSYYETYYDDDLLGINLLEEMDYESGTLPIGNISANEITVRLANDDRRFSVGNIASPISPLMLKNRRVRAWFGIDVNGTLTWSPLGVFWTMDWNAPDNEMWAEVVAFDRLEFIRSTQFSPAGVFEDYTIADLFEEVLTDAGLLSTEYVIDPTLTTVIPYAWFEECTHRYALQKLAEAGLAKVYCDRLGRIVVEKYVVADTPRAVFTNDDIFSEDHPLAWSEIANNIEVTASPLRASSQQEIYSDIDEFAVPAGGMVTKFYIFVQSPCVDVQTPTFTQSGADIHIETHTVYAWAVSVTFHNSGATSQNVTSVDVEGKILESTGSIKCVASDETSISANGLTTVTVENNFIQSRTVAQDIADTLLASYKDPRKDITLECRGNIFLYLGDRITAPDFRDLVSDDFLIVRQEFKYNPGLRATITARRVTPGTIPDLDEGGYGGFGGFLH